METGSHPDTAPLGLLARMDIYLIDQLLRGRLAPGMRVLDAGCGWGRNVAYLLRQGFSVWGVDRDPEAVLEARELAATLAPAEPPDRFRVAPVEHTGFDDAAFDFVVSNAVLHFATDARQFESMLREMWRVLAPQGILFVRLATTIGIAERLRSRGDGWFDLPDGSSRFLVDEAALLGWTDRLGGRLADPLKTTLVQNLRSMTTWVVLKGEPETEGQR